MSNRDSIRQQSLAAVDSGTPAVIDLGGLVVCDGCDTDFTDSRASGGFLFGSYAYGPCCEQKQFASIRSYGEEWNIRGRCPQGAAFADWLRALRNSVPGGNQIRIRPLRRGGVA